MTFRGVWICLCVFAASRLVLTLVGTLAHLLILPELGDGYYVWHEGVPAWLDIWGVWDTGWFLSIVEGGYMAAPSDAAETPAQANWAFFPLYPYLAKALVVVGIAPFPSLLLVSNVAFVLALMVAWVETRDLHGEPAANLVVALLSLWPGTYVFSSAYSESTFLLFALLCLRFSRQRRWWLAGLAASAAVLTRNTGAFLCFATLTYFLLPYEAGRASLRNRLFTRETLHFAAAMCLPVVALLSFMALLLLETGDALAFLHVQSAWNRRFYWPWETLALPFFGAVPFERWPDLVAIWIATLGAAALLWRRQWADAAFVCPSVLIFLCAGPLSAHRLVLTLAPLFLLGAVKLNQQPTFAAPAIGIMALVNGAMMVGWSIGLRIY